MKFLFAFILIYQLSVAASDLRLLPQTSFKISSTEKVVLVDIVEQNVAWIYNPEDRILKSTTEINFKMAEDGFPALLLSLNDKVFNGDEELKISGSLRELQGNATPGNLMYIKTLRTAGEHRLKVVSQFTVPPNRVTFMNINYGMGRFTEGFFPANLRYDTFQVRLNLSIVGSTKMSVFTNGNLEKKSNQEFSIDFSGPFNSSTFYLDMVPEDQVVQRQFQLRKMNGNPIQFTAYAEKGDLGESLLLSTEQKIRASFPKVEAKYGDFPHSRFLYKMSSRSFEGAFAGAVALRPNYNTVDLAVHEMAHSYFLANVRPLRGSDMWLFEGLGQWASKFEQGNIELVPDFEKIELSKNWLLQIQEYDAHEGGRTILAALDFKLRNQGGLFAFLPRIFRKFQGQAIDTATFFNELSQITGDDFTAFKAHYFQE